MGVEVRSDGCGRVTKPVADDLHVHSGCQGKTGVRVSKVVQSYARDVRLAQQARKGGADVVGTNKSTVLVREDETLVLPACAPSEPFSGLLRPPAVECCGRTSVDGDGAGAGASLGYH